MEQGGGERGIFKSTDGGKSWIQKLGDDEWIGATDLIIDPETQKYFTRLHGKDTEL